MWQRDRKNKKIIRKIKDKNRGCNSSDIFKDESGGKTVQEIVV